MTPTLRRLGDADAVAALEVARLCDIAEIGEVDTDLEDIQQDLHAPEARWWGVDRDRASGEGGDLEAFAWVSKPPAQLALHGDVRVRPGADPALGQVLLEQVRRDAGEIDPSRPLHLFAHVDDVRTRSWFKAADGRIVRHFWRMVIDLGDEPPVLVVPDGVVVRDVVDTDEDKRTVADIVHTAFRDHFGHVDGEDPSYESFLERTHGASGFDLALWGLALVEGQPAAAVICREFPDMGFVSTLGTLREFRGRGLGRALLLKSFRTFHARGRRRVALGVDAANPTGAVGLYESVGMRAEHSWALYEISTVPAAT